MPAFRLPLRLIAQLYQPATRLAVISMLGLAYVVFVANHAPEPGVEMGLSVIDRRIGR